MPKVITRRRKAASARRGKMVRPNPPTEDEALNRIADQRLNEPRYPIEKLLKKMGYELER